MPGIESSRPQKRGRAHTPAPPIPTVPESLIWVVRIGGMVALACAAAISAQTLFRLGRLLGFPPETAWLLPAALDVCAGVCIWTAAVIPVGHPARRRAATYATLALLFTVVSNVLYHAITLGQWTWQDDSLMGVSALPPIVVEILLHMQTLVANGHAPGLSTATAKPTAAAPRSTVLPTVQEPTAGALSTAGPAAADSPGTVDSPPATDTADDRQPDSGDRQPPTDSRRPPASRQSNGAPTVDIMDTWATIGRPLYEEIRDRKRADGVPAGRQRPSEGEFHAALTAKIAELGDSLAVPESAREMSVSNAKRIRKYIEDRFPDLAPLIHSVPTEGAA